jgi:tight adherence protein B
MIASSFSHFVYHSTAGSVLAAIVFGLAVFASVRLAMRARNIRRIRTRLGPHVAAHAEAQAAATKPPARFAFLSGLFQATERSIGRLGFWRQLALSLERADSPLRPAEFFYIMVGSGFVLVALFALLGVPAIGLLLAFWLGVLPPLAVLGIKAGKREREFDAQLPDVLMTMAGSLRAGHTFRQAMQAIVDEGQEPAAKEFKRVLLEMGIGRPVDETMTDMASRMKSKNFEYVISVVSVQRDVGGSLAGLFDMVSETVRQRQQFQQRVGALTSMSRTSAYILGAMPFFIAGALTLLKPHYLSPLFTTATGRFLLVIALAGIALGALVLRRIVSFRMT